jgi:hypothetical protein
MLKSGQKLKGQVFGNCKANFKIHNKDRTLQTLDTNFEEKRLVHLTEDPS